MIRVDDTPQFIVNFKIKIFDFLAYWCERIAEYFGYPENPGIPLYPAIPYKWLSLDDFTLPRRVVTIDSNMYPENYFEIFFGKFRTVDTVARHFYTNETDGFYSFYMEAFQNMIFLPDWLSEFLQIHFNCCTDLTQLEMIREVTFFILIAYYQIISLRLFLSFFVSINPYTIPFIYLIGLVDWVEDSLQISSPSLFGSSFLGVMMLFVVGKFTDYTNNLVFTMPYLPRERVLTWVQTDSGVKFLYVFKHLPILWYKYPIPNELREYWFFERQDILIYLQNAYKGTDIQFLPDQVIQHLTDKF